jgi:hypothetical protein
VSRFGRLINAGFGRCKHRVLGTCVDAADGCCAGVACAICVKLLDADGEVVDAVSLAWDGTGYSGSVGGFSFESYWLDNYGDCEFHVIITAGGYIEPIHIIKTKGDYTDPACCMNPSGETEVDDGTDTYTMTWGPVDPLILARRLVSDGCYERFCGDCDCAPRKLCLQVSSDVCSVTKIISLAENYADPDCPLPVWDLDFTCGTFSFSGQVALVRDEYTDGCILQMSGTRGGAVDEESHDYAVTDCAALSASFTLTEGYSDYLIEISPADCDACSSLPCPDGCCFAPDLDVPQDPPSYIINGVISAPNCPDLDGQVLEFFVHGEGIAKACGWCLAWSSNFATGSAVGTRVGPTPCSKGLFAVIDCANTRTVAEPGTDICCTNLRLRGALMTPGDSVPEADWDTLPVLALLSCTCGDGGLPPGVSAIWDISGAVDLEPGCDWNLPLHCTNLTGATLSI